LNLTTGVILFCLDAQHKAHQWIFWAKLASIALMTFDISPVVHSIAASHLSTYLRTLKWIWPLCETIHFIGLAMLVGIAGFFDGWARA
jgi:hypothetical protein